MTSGLISYGSHTVRHKVWITLTEKEFNSEMVGSIHELMEKGVIDRP